MKTIVMTVLSLFEVFFSRNSGSWVSEMFYAAGSTNVLNVKLPPSQINPEMADLLKMKVNGFSYTFQNTGIDYFGPFEVEFLRKTRKYWCCLFTCLTSRAIRIEVVEGLDTDACMMALKRFMARRGGPHTIVSEMSRIFQ